MKDWIDWVIILFDNRKLHEIYQKLLKLTNRENWALQLWHRQETPLLFHPLPQFLLERRFLLSSCLELWAVRCASRTGTPRKWQEREQQLIQTSIMAGFLPAVSCHLSHRRRLCTRQRKFRLARPYLWSNCSESPASWPNKNLLYHPSLRPVIVYNCWIRCSIKVIPLN